MNAAKYGDSFGFCKGFEKYLCDNVVVAVVGRQSSVLGFRFSVAIGDDNIGLLKVLSF